MIPVINLYTDIQDFYCQDNFASGFRDKLKIKVAHSYFIPEIDATIMKVKFPPNMSKRSYDRNMIHALKKSKNSKGILAPTTFRLMDYNYLSLFQKSLFGYSVAKSVQLILRINRKNIKNSCIVVYDAAESINKEILEWLARECGYIVLATKDIRRVSRTREMILANYGVSPIVTNEIKECISAADFIIATKLTGFEKNKPVWLIDNIIKPSEEKGIYIDNVTFSTPWQVDKLSMTPELLGALLFQMDVKGVSNALEYNNIYLDRILYGCKEINLGVDS